VDAVREVCLDWKSACMLLHCNILSETKIETPFIETGYKGIHEVSRGT